MRHAGKVFRGGKEQSGKWVSVRLWTAFDCWRGVRMERNQVSRSGGGQVEEVQGRKLSDFFCQFEIGKSW